MKMANQHVCIKIDLHYHHLKLSLGYTALILANKYIKMRQRCLESSNLNHFFRNLVWKNLKEKVLHVRTDMVRT